MANIFEFVAEKRDLSGKSAAKAVRRNGNVPAVVYGGSAAPQSIVLSHNEVIKHLEHEAVYSHILDLTIDGKTEKAILKDIQRHPAKPIVMHMDFVRVDKKHALKVHVPLHFINEDICVGVKMGGVITHAMVDIEVSCLPAVLPEYLEVDLAALDIGDSIHLSNIVLPKGVQIPVLAQGGNHDHTVAQVMKTKAVSEDEDEVEVADDAESDAEE
ncbi:MAG: 50S ribosomal protein L25/general stress protein Ctc [Methylococcales bacterium]|nr:50S ribosomal protein L25/general stress protein Ctc [Methylococcales bacterium]